MRKTITYFLSSILVLVSCEFEKTEHTEVMDEGHSSVFSYYDFILHENSISLYSRDDNKVFNDIYLYENGTPIRNGIHSFFAGYNYGLITFQDENIVEFINMVDFVSKGTLVLDQPRNIFTQNYQYILISFGNHISGGVALVNDEMEIVKTIPTNIVTGKIFGLEDYLFVMCDGSRTEDSLFYRFYSSWGSPIHKLDSFSVGTRPVDCVEMKIQYSDYSHKGLAILCMGNDNIPASVVLFDLVTMQIAAKYFFESTLLKPENLFWLKNYQNSEIKLLSYVNNKLCELTLNNPIETMVIIDKNVSQLLDGWDYYIGVSRDTTGNISYLYRFDPTYELVDSLPIAGKAIKFAEKY